MSSPKSKAGTVRSVPKYRSVNRQSLLAGIPVLAPAVKINAASAYVIAGAKVANTIVVEREIP